MMQGKHETKGKNQVRDRAKEKDQDKGKGKDKDKKDEYKVNNIAKAMQREEMSEQRDRR